MCHHLQGPCSFGPLELSIADKRESEGECTLPSPNATASDLPVQIELKQSKTCVELDKLELRVKVLTAEMGLMRRQLWKAHNRQLCGSIALAISARIFTAVFMDARKSELELRQLRNRLKTLRCMAEAVEHDANLLGRWNETMALFCTAVNIQHEEFFRHMERLMQAGYWPVNCLYLDDEYPNPPKLDQYQLVSILHLTYSGSRLLDLRRVASHAIHVLYFLSQQQDVDWLDSCSVP